MRNRHIVSVAFPGCNFPRNEVLRAEPITLALGIAAAIEDDELALCLRRDVDEIATKRIATHKYPPMP
jgi:hypothetical protein